MQKIIIEEPYRFLAPHRGSFLPDIIQAIRLVDIYLRFVENVVSYELRGEDLLKESLRQGHGVILAPNHCRYADPIAIGWLARACHVHIYTMASWHLFKENWLQAKAMQLCGGFSLYREGNDRQSLELAIEILVEAVRPLVIFPEGTVFRTNDYLQPLLDGVAFLARAAAKKRAKDSGGKVVIHPIGLKYLPLKPIQEILPKPIAELEERFALTTHAGKTTQHEEQNLVARVRRLVEALLSMQEVRCFGHTREESERERRNALIEHLLAPIESKWNLSGAQRPAIARIKDLRTKMVPKLLVATDSSTQGQEIWRDLEAMYLAQQIDAYPKDYLNEPTESRLLETVERIQEDLTDASSIKSPLHLIIEVGEPVEISPDRAPRGSSDPIMSQLKQKLDALLAKLSLESPRMLEANDNTL